MILERNTEIKRSIILVFIIFFVSGGSYGQDLIENLLIETYYIADANDANSAQANGLEEGMVTYRVYLDLAPDISVVSIFGDENHPLFFSSTAPFFNSLAGQTMGHNIIEAGFTVFPVTLLDSYLSFAASTGTHCAIPKEIDPDGSLYPDGVGIEQILSNDDPDMIFPITERDGLISPPDGSTGTAPDGFFAIPSIDSLSAVFGTITSRSSFTSDSVYTSDSSMPLFALEAPSGVAGKGDENLFLIGQFTTAGELTFKINVVLKDLQGNLFPIVADGENLQTGELVSPFLSFPPECGCTDPDYLEFDPGAPCDDGSCETLIVIGCMDPEACNFDPDVNFNIPELCCYGADDCGQLDPSLVCPSLGLEDPFSENLLVYPNPTRHQFFIKSDARQITNIQLFDITGKQVLSRSGDLNTFVAVDVSELNSGIFVMRILTEDRKSQFVKLVITE